MGFLDSQAGSIPTLIDRRELRCGPAQRPRCSLHPTDAPQPRTWPDAARDCRGG